MHFNDAEKQIQINLLMIHIRFAVSNFDIFKK